MLPILHARRIGRGALALVLLGLSPFTAHSAPGRDNGLVNLAYYYPGTAQKDLAQVQSALNAVLQKRINATVSLNLIDWGSYDQKTKLLFAAGQPCDLAFTATWTNNYYQLIANGDLLPLDDLLAKNAPRTLASMPKTTWNAARVNGKIYAVINQQLFPAFWGVEVRKDIAQEYHLNVNAWHSYADVTPFLAKVKAAEPGMVPLISDDQYEGLVQYFGLDALVDTAVVRYNDRSLRVFDPLESPEFKQAATLAYQWHQAGYFTKDLAPAADARAAFKAGKYAATLSQWRPGNFEEMKLKAQYGYDMVGKDLVPPLLTTGGPTATMTGICRTSSHPDVAMKFLELLNSDPQVYNLITHGIEGKNYVYADRTHGVVTPPAGQTTTTDGYYPNTDWEFGNQFNALLTDRSQIGDYALQRHYNQIATPSIALGFSVDTTPIKTQLAQISAVENQCMKPLQKGLINPATGIPQCIQALKGAGESQVIAEVQRQLNAWARANK